MDLGQYEKHSETASNTWDILALSLGVAPADLCPPFGRAGLDWVWLLTNPFMHEVLHVQKIERSQPCQSHALVKWWNHVEWHILPVPLRLATPWQLHGCEAKKRVFSCFPHLCVFVYLLGPEDTPIVQGVSVTTDTGRLNASTTFHLKLRLSFPTAPKTNLTASANKFEACVLQVSFTPASKSHCLNTHTAYSLVYI